MSLTAISNDLRTWWASYVERRNLRRQESSLAILWWFSRRPVIHPRPERVSPVSMNSRSRTTPCGVSVHDEAGAMLGFLTAPEPLLMSDQIRR